MSKLFASLALAASLAAAPVVWTIRADSAGAPTQLVQLDPNSGQLLASTTLPGPYGYGGGLVWNGTSFYGIRSDASQNAELVSISSAGAVTALLSLGTGTFGGLTEGYGHVWAVHNDAQFNSTLLRIDLNTSSVSPHMSLGQYVTGGLDLVTNQSGVDPLIAAQNLPTGESFGLPISTLHLFIAPSYAMPPTVNGVYSARAAEPNFAIINDAQGNARLLNPQAGFFPIGPGFYFASLAYADAAPGVIIPGGDVPEPFSLFLFLPAVALLACRRRSQS
jgi:hypothetical protein